MSIEQALQLFEVSDISDIDKDQLKKKNRELNKKYHPDNAKTGNQEKFLLVKEAYDFLSDALEKIKQYKDLYKETKLETIVIPLNKLIDLYDGKVLSVGNSDCTMNLDKSTMMKNNTLILSDVSIEHNSLVTSFDNIQPWNVNDNYSIDCVIPVEKLGDSEKIKIKLHDKEMNIDMKYQSMKLKFTLPHSVKVEVNVSKKIIVESDT